MTTGSPKATLSVKVEGGSVSLSPWEFGKKVMTLKQSLFQEANIDEEVKR
jgi:hypothetical protein